MGFKTKKLANKINSWWNKKSWVKKITYIASFFSIFLILFFWYLILNAFKSFDFSLNGLVNNFSVIDLSKEKKDVKINFLITWRWGWNHDAPNLTDSIILLWLNLNKWTIIMLSIPRDLYVKRWENAYWKINEIYAYSLNKNKKDEDKAMWDLKNKISQITGEKIDYYLNIDFAWFKAIIDMLWWVSVDVEENIYDSTYPTPSWGYTTFTLKKWTWTLDWETALKYARSRHSTSDFDRSLRQQKLISAMKDKIISEWYLSNLWKIKDLYTTAKPYFKTDITLDWIIKLVSNYWKIANNSQIISLNLNNTCYYNSPNCSAWWFLYNPPMANFWWASVLIPNWTTWTKNLEKYDEIQKFSNFVFNYSDMFTEKQEINIFYTWSSKKIAWDLVEGLKQNWFSFPKKNYIWLTETWSYNNTTVYYNNIWENSKTLDALKTILNWEYKEINLPIFSKDPNTRIEIILWDDFNEVYNLNWTWSTNIN